jgi:hypothetical protein
VVRAVALEVEVSNVVAKVAEAKMTSLIIVVPVEAPTMARKAGVEMLIMPCKMKQTGMLTSTSIGLDDIDVAIDSFASINFFFNPVLLGALYNHEVIISGDNGPTS